MGRSGRVNAIDGSGEMGDGPSPPGLGEVVVCASVVTRYAREDGVDGAEQLAWTIVHGVLHLLGYDHEVDHGEMRDRERALLPELADLRGSPTRFALLTWRR